jgi:exopolyphosphatase/guanosine-5'-triphosphate,3'-diphosphate pyrophosphatase
LSERIAAVDVGSLTVRLAVAERTAPGRCRVLHRERAITALGEGLARSGALAPGALSRTLLALQGFLASIRAHGVEVCQAVATQAVRQAENRQEVLRQLEDTLGLPVRLLSAREEARFTLQGVLSVLEPEFLKNPNVIVFDVGGGSSEFALVRPRKEPLLASLPLGVLTLSQAHPLGDPPEPKAVASLKETIAKQLKIFYLENFAPSLQGPPLLVGTAGAVTTLAAMALEMTEYDPDRVNNLILTRSRVEDLAARLAALPEAERARLPGLEAAKAGVMVAGALIVLTILEIFDQDFLVVSDAGLLEGVLQELAA